VSPDRPFPLHLLLVLLFLPIALAGGPAAAASGRDEIEVKHAVAHDVSAPLTLLKPAPDAPFAEHEPRAIRAWKDLPPMRPDASLQSSIPPLLVPGLLNRFEGIGDFFANTDASKFHIGGFPPDTDGDVGPNHYVQIVNSSFAVFDKTGRLLYGTVPTNTVWSGFGGACEARRDGDGVVLYDALADRWFISEFAVQSAGPWFQCVAVSTTGDPTGQYARYAYQYDGFNDYGKFGVWPDAYYATYNSFNANRVYRGAVLCAFDRASMLQGLPAVEQCFKLFQSNGPPLPDGSNILYGNILPTDLDGNNPPPQGAPNYMLSFDGANLLQLWKFHVDWVNPANTTLTGSSPTCNATSCPPINIPVQAYMPLCYDPGTPLPDGGSILPDGGQPPNGTCVPQLGGQPLDSLGDRPMFRVSYRRFADHESLLMNHSIQAASGGGGGGVRWYELRDPNNAVPVLYQQGTYAPDSGYRWLGSMAMDSAGNIAIGFSNSSATIYPSISYTGRNSGDALGQMTLGEGQITAGSGPQIVPGSDKASTRWGDYSNMSVDPSDDCTFWYTNEYIPPAPSPGTPGFWHTTVASFRVPSCQLFFPVLNPQTGVLERGGLPISFTFSIPLGTNPTGPFALSVSGLPAGVSSSFTQSSINAGGSSQLTLTAASGTAITLRRVPVAVAATPPATAQTPSQPRYQLLTLDVLGNDFSVGPAATSVLLSAGTSQQVTLQTGPVHGNSDTIAFGIQGVLPPGLAASFNPPSVLTGGSTTLTLSADPNISAQSATLAVRVSSANSTHVVGVAQTTLTLPTASLDSPLTGSRLLGLQAFTVSGTVSVGTSLAKVEVLADGKPVAAGVASPSTFTIDTTHLPNGLRQFSARTTDANGGAGVSLAVPMTVDNPTGCGCSGAGGVDAASLFLALSFVLFRRASGRRPSGSLRRGRRNRPGRPPSRGLPCGTHRARSGW
jgi:hypothetical protein